MKITNRNLIPERQNPTPDYYCTWQTQLYVTSDGKTEGQRAMTPEVIADGDVFRTYDVPAVMSISMTMEKIAALKSATFRWTVASARMTVAA